MTNSRELVFELPPHMPPRLAFELSMWLTGHMKETGLVRYLALALLYTSWHFDEVASLDAYQLAFQDLTDDDGPTLLENLAHPPAYSRRGTSFGLSRISVKEAQKAANAWKAQLTRPGLNVLRLHLRGLEILDYVVSQQADAETRPESVLLFHTLGRILESNDVHSASSPQVDGVVQFANAISALEHLLKKTQGNSKPPTSSPTLNGSSTIKASAAQTVAVYQPMDAKQALRRLPAHLGPEANALHRQVLEVMSESTGLKGVTEVPEGNPLEQLYARFPHFKQPLDFISDALALASCGDEGRQVRIPPILLKGVPGTGKTYFAQELARVLGTEFFERDMAVTSEAWVLTGMDASWKNSKPGLVFDALVMGRTANPLISLNEIDKGREGGSHGSPVAALYSLLEPTSSRLFKDEFVALPIDASRVIWVLTANEGTVPEPILTRLEIFEIQAPSKEQCRAIAKSVWDEVLSRYIPRGSGFPQELSEEILECVSSLSPRLMRKALLYAAGAAARNNSKVLAPGDLKAGMVRYAEPVRRSIGFLSH
jgi:ATP-dependent Lon protease